MKQDREIEKRCAAFSQVMEDRIVKLQTEVNTKVDTEQVEDIVKSVISNNIPVNGLNTEASVDIEKTAEKKVSEIRYVIVYGITECTDKLPAVRKNADT